MLFVRVGQLVSQCVCLRLIISKLLPVLNNQRSNPGPTHSYVPMLFIHCIDLHCFTAGKNRSPLVRLLAGLFALDLLLLVLEH